MAKRNYEVIETATGRLIENDDDVLQPGQTLRVPMMFRDGMSEMQREVVADKAMRHAAQRFGLNDALGLHKPGQRFSVDAAARAHVEEVYQDEKRKLQDAWKNPPTAEVSGEFRGQQPGDQCTINGAPGHLNHRLECVPDQRRQDALPRTVTTAAAQRIKDEAWLQSVKDLESAWKGPAR